MSSADLQFWSTVFAAVAAIAASFAAWQMWRQRVADRGADRSARLQEIYLQVEEMIRERGGGFWGAARTKLRAELAAIPDSLPACRAFAAVALPSQGRDLEGPALEEAREAVRAGRLRQR